MATPGEVYILHNCEKKGSPVKIGWTSGSAEDRAAKLSGTSVTEPFIVLYSTRVPDARRVERRLHARFAEYRIGRKEFFRVSPKHAIQALLEESGIVPVEPERTPEIFDLTAAVTKQYGSLLKHDLTRAELHHDGTSTTLVCTFGRDDRDKVISRRDVDFLATENEEPLFTATRNSWEAGRTFLALRPLDIAEFTTLLSEDGGWLIGDLHYRAGLDDNTIRTELNETFHRISDANTGDVEADLRVRHQIPATHLDLVRVVEHGDRFLLTLTEAGDFYGIYDVRVSEDEDPERAHSKPRSHAVLTSEPIENIDGFESVDIGYRETDRWGPAHSGPRITVAAKIAQGIPFEQEFFFLP
ncbi:GIY-YIG nuclease family protein [Saccharopolyspora endophytica]|uniref:GIY-YIG nuclease family protein n=1 Tax=Saccharopolyspora endophytica TaxID=543886 RepID=A0ABS5DK65_9PSEU|nr:GIY-YIG nuclease family protein [Saccharopolyspora endophytica]MBQ0926678.1 GIY-YIG nuclease family protein [Saccharopolyspora endophytica]